ncbi:Gfo/Idh/MocA family protein [Actinopolymorpha alba]|uniref:Gfo/Idh/MocA family protein n=1 Tax=Actinopolymorpha alba TaxID=533267 RepID=UPI00037D5875|nr:Gfo/Idh/MocA family oxidoreductase [Actinopolymorpha alba]
MITELSAVSDAVAISAPPSVHRPIAVVGAGAIMDVAHLPAYRAAGLPVVGVFDIDHERARAVAERHEIPTVYRDLAEVLADDTVEVVDIAVPAARQEEVATAVIQAGRHVLAQKPFAPDPPTGIRLVELAESMHTVLAVNQQLRFDEGMAAAHRMVELGWIGDITAFSITVDIWTEWSDWPWLLETERLEIMNHSIHYHDVVRWFLGEPAGVFCAAGRLPGQRAVGETRTISTYLYDSGVSAVVHANHTNDHGDNKAEFRIGGTSGAIRGTLGLLYDYPHGRPDTLEVHSTVLPTDGWLPYPVTTRWIPDAFLGPMASVLWAVADGQPLRSSGLDNLGTLRLVEALYTSIATKQVVALG